MQRHSCPLFLTGNWQKYLTYSCSFNLHRIYTLTKKPLGQCYCKYCRYAYKNVTMRKILAIFGRSSYYKQNMEAVEWLQVTNLFRRNTMGSRAHKARIGIGETLHSARNINSESTTTHQLTSSPAGSSSWAPAVIWWPPEIYAIGKLTSIRRPKKVVITSNPSTLDRIGLLNNAGVTHLN